MSVIFIELWNHGTAGDIEMPCGEVDVFNVSGERIGSEILKELMNDKPLSLKVDWFGGLPTEQALLVEVKNESNEDGLHLDVVGFSFLD
jgi:hypothetical protein